MKLNQLSLNILIVLSGGLLACGATAAELEKQAERESSWTPVQITLPGVRGETRFLQTETGALRLLEMASAYSVPLKVSGRDGYFRHARTQTQLRRGCDNLASVVEYEVERKNRFQVEVLVHPLNERAGKELAVENRIHSSRIEPVLSFVNNSTPLVTQARLKQLESELAQQIKAQDKELQQSGILKFNWSGIDDLACDLIFNQVKLEIRVTSHFDAARLRRKEVISAAQIQSLSEKLRQMTVAEQSPAVRLLSRSANLGVLLSQDFGNNYGNIVQTKFHILQPKLISSLDGSVMNISAQAAVQVARQLDDLSAGKDVNLSVISTAVEWGNY